MKKKMQLTIYAKDITGPAAQIRVIAESLVGAESTQNFKSVEDLTQWLLQSVYEDLVLILVAKKREDLEDFQHITNFFNRIRIVLLLPDREPETIKIGYKLQPRFLGFVDGGFSMIKSILKEMISPRAIKLSSPENS